MESNKVIRINKVLRELNISLESAVQVLHSKNIYIETNPNSKISQNDYKMLSYYFENRAKAPQSVLDIEKEIGINLFKKLENGELENFYIYDNYYKLNVLSEITELNIRSGKMDNLEFIKKSNKIISLTISDCNLYNLEGVTSLTELIYLELNGNKMDGYSQIKELPKLSHLIISNEKLPELHFLTNKLKDLALIKCQISDIGQLKYLKNLSTLSLENNNITDIKPIQYLNKLKVLDLSNNKINNIHPLEGFTSFIRLNLSSNKLRDISALKNIEIVEDLFIGNNEIIDLTPLYYELRNNRINFINYYENPLQYPPISRGVLTEREILDWFENNLSYARNRILVNKQLRSKKLDLGNCGLTDLSLLPELFDGMSHLHELIISNYYAKFDPLQKHWRKETSDGLYPNNIIAIPENISRLKNLKILILGGDWKEGDNWNRWRIKSVAEVLTLKNLKILNLSNNQISSIDNIANLNKLEIFYANNNNIKKVEYLGKFPSLHELYLSNNEIIDVDFLKDLESVKSLDLHSNKIENISPLIQIIMNLNAEDSKWRINTVSLKDNNLDEAFVNLLRNYSQSERFLELENYFKRLKQGKSTIIKRIKLILLGNTRAGKTTLADLLSRGIKADGNSTHGVNFFNFKINDIIVKGYDFGGQDYYHNTHYSFFDEKAMYVVIWGNEQLNKFSIKDNDFLFPLNYWLGSLNKYAYDDLLTRFNEYLDLYIKPLPHSSVLLHNSKLSQNQAHKIRLSVEELNGDTTISSKNLKINIAQILKEIHGEEHHNFCIDEYPFFVFLLQNINTNKTWVNESDLIKFYGYIRDFLDFNFLSDGLKLNEFFTKKISELVKETQVLKIDSELEREFERNKDLVVIDLALVRTLKVEISGYPLSELDSLLASLHSILACYYFKIRTEIKDKLELRELKDIVIIDIEKFTDWIYQILDQRDFKTTHKNIEIRGNLKSEHFSSDKKGYFDRGDAVKWLDNQMAIDNLDYLLAFMLQNKLIFKMQKQQRYFAPNYLNDYQTKTETLFLNSFEIPLVKYVFSEYYHTSIFSEIINEYFDKLLLDDSEMQYVLWKNKVLLYELLGSNKLVYLCFDLTLDEFPYISISRFNNSVGEPFILEICTFIESFIKCYDYQKMILSQKGNYIPYELLESNLTNENLKKSNVFTFQNVVYKKSDFKMFLKNKEDYPMKKVFISYSHSDTAAMKELCKFLSGLERNGQIEKWTDLELQAGMVVKTDILSKLEEADIVILLISQNFISSDFIFNNELPAAMKKKLHGSGDVIPVYLSSCTIFDLKLELEIQEGDNKLLQMGDYYFTPQNEDNNLVPVEEWQFPAQAWNKVYQEIKKLIN